MINSTLYIPRKKQHSTNTGDNKRIEASHFSMAIQFGEGLTYTHRAWGSFLAARFDRFSSYRNYRWGDFSSIFGTNMASEAISDCLI